MTRVAKNSDQQDTVTLLQELLNDAEAGVIDGIACVSITRDHQGHQRDAAGSAVRFSAHTLGALRLLGDDLSEACRRAQPNIHESTN